MKPSDVPTWLVRAITGEGSPAESEVARVVAPGPRLSARERLEIYRTAYVARLVECLADDYPVVAQTAGDGAFRELAEAYVRRHPSSSPSLNAFGRRFAAFCREVKPRGFAGPAAFLSDLAALEWAIVEVIHSAESEKLELAAMAALPVESWAAARLTAGEAVRLVPSEYPVNAFYRHCRDRGAPPPLPEPSPTATLVYRKDWKVWRMDVPPWLAPVLESLLAGRPLAEALAHVDAPAPSDAEQRARTEARVQAAFGEWVAAGVFTKVQL